MRRLLVLLIAAALTLPGALVAARPGAAVSVRRTAAPSTGTRRGRRRG